MGWPFWWELGNACIEKLGKLPSQANLTDWEIMELLAYYRIEKKMQDICPNCMEEMRKQEKECFICKKKYSEEDGIKHSRQKTEKSEGNSALLQQIAAMSSNKKLTEQEKEEIKKKFLEQAKASGVRIRQ